MSKILIIEDEEAIRRVLLKILSEENPLYQVFEAADGLSGTELIKREDFDLVLCDIKMPKMDGVEVLEAAKKNQTRNSYCYDIGSWGFGNGCQHHAPRRL
jgi:CheY-like chemotaxis protein